MRRLLLCLPLALLLGCPEVVDDDDVIVPVEPTPEETSDYTRTGSLFCGAGGWSTDIASAATGSYESYNCVGPVAVGSADASDGTFTVQTNPMLGLAATPTAATQ
jgi:hypothetical protein